jgi:uncharacterized delta-60 repeat protein
MRIHQLLKLAAVPLLLLVLTAAAQGQSALDGFDPNANGPIRIVVVQPDGKILLGGDFTTLSPNGGAAVARNNIARLNADGTLDTAFNPNANDSVLAITVQPDGKILVGGYFHGPNSIGGQTRNCIARLDATSGLADSFDPNANFVVSAIVVQTDGKILVGGSFNDGIGPITIGGQTRNDIARLDPITGLADSFDPNADGDVLAIVLRDDGKILAGGIFSNIGGQPRSHIARLEATTGVADSFNPNANDYITSIATQADGKILVGGQFNGPNSIGGQTRNRIARLDPTTGLADSFDPDANAGVNAIAVQADGKVLACGNFQGPNGIGGATRNYIARLDAVTGLADSFDPNPAGGLLLTIALQADGKVLTGGHFTTLAPNGGAAVTRNGIARLESDGRLDRTLDLGPISGGTAGIAATAVQVDGKILIGGLFTTVLGVPRNNIARLNSDGTLDSVFDPNASGTVYSIALQADGKVLAGGEFTSIGGQTRRRISRLNATTGLADALDPNASDTVYSIALQTDGKILVGGLFNGPNSIGGQSRNYIARLDAATGLADSFDPNANDFVSGITVQADGRILVGGGFSGPNSIGGQARSCIARLDATTGLADSFDPSANNSVFSIAIGPGGKILASGAFLTIGGQTRHRLARLDPSTGSADSFNPNANNSIFSIAVQADGKVLAGGNFTNIGGQPRNYVARLDATTGLADSFNPSASAYVAAIALPADGKVLAGGGFISIGGQPRGSFARLTNDTAALQDLVVTQTTITWTRGGSSAQCSRVTFESSTDNVSYTPLGNGTPTGSNWTLTGLNLSTGQNIYVRARAFYGTGENNSSGSITESVRYGPAGTPGPTPTPTPTPTAAPSSTPTPTPGTPTPTPTATATVAPSATPTGTPTPTPTSTPSPSATPGTFGNISTRLRVETGDNALIGGFIITGTQPKKIIVRAMGPSLSSFFPGVLGDPVLELRDSSGALLATNDNWRSDQEAEINATGIPPSNDLESAIVATLPANNAAYTAIVRGVNNATGIGVVEAYDLDHTVDSRLGNISTRGLVQTGDDVMIGGLIVLEQNPLRVIVRAIGPSLPVPGALGDPILELHDGNGALIAGNDSWRSDQEAEIIATGIPPSSDLEAAIVRNFAPGSYTAIVRGVNNTTGVAVVEAYGLN